ncbi:cation channel sperm-associated auxiliary subunit gamma isoform X6 [Psammomys obesus]|uniref:cation channel sperm-associated auxiliary subunit gamma isoform X6 n=1 Tax=Psammomys obesus TaxID=48139 RepID=UPI002452F2D9|nr:cation channel sperm-associated auxiliary subunit gamma isoform X6 [Psammomys obesus]
MSRARAKRKGRGEEPCEDGDCEGRAKSAERRRGAENRKGLGKARNKRRDLLKCSSSMVRWPAMLPVSPVLPRKPQLWAFWALLLVARLSPTPWALDHHRCSWLAVLNKFERVGSHFSQDRFLDQEPMDTVAKVFEKLSDSPVDTQEKYLGFPYYLQINFSCTGQDSKELARKGHLMGMRPVVLISYRYPVNFYRWKIENLQVQMEAAPLRSTEHCAAEAMCILNWYTPMPIKNGSVVMSVDISSNGIGPFIPRKRFYMNMNGFLKKDADERVIYTIGYESIVMKSNNFKKSKSRPLWYTVNHAPVLILGGIEGEKALLITDTNFQDASLVELSIDSCWVGSYYCPMLSFSATIFDAISTESTLFIRQNQLVYYFTGRYSTLFDTSHSSSRWVRVLPTECIKKLCPVFVNGNGSEYVLALNTGIHEGYIHIGTITDGLVSFRMVPTGWSVCDQLPGTNCTIDWATYIADEKNLLLLLEILNENLDKVFYLLSFNLDTEALDILYILPQYVPQASGDFLVLLGTETYTNTPMIPEGLFFNTFNNMLYIWGNFILQSYNRIHFIYLADFPKEYTIKYMVNSYHGEMVFVTDKEEVMRLRDLPEKQHFARQELYHAPPPLVSQTLGFHNNKTLAVYQGLVYYLLWLHSKYDKPYADPVHDPTWRWWQHKKQYKDYYFYLSSNWLAAEGVYIDMSSYQKLYNISNDHGLPEIVFLDKGTSFSFTVFLSSQEDTLMSAATLGTTFQVEKKLAVAVVVADPDCLKATVKQEVLLNRKAVLYKIKIEDRKVCYDQGLSGHNLKKTSMMIKVLGSAGKCFQTTFLGTSMQGNLMVPVLIGCPPGKRLAFDVTYTILHSREINKHYFDCVKSNPEMPCFLFRDLFQPFFLVQDMVTGDSGSFLGSYLLKVVGGGRTLDTIRDYTEEEIFRYNSPLDNSESLIWRTKVERTTWDKKFYIMSYLSPGIEWLCLENSPCHDITPGNVFAPEFFLKLLVSNRGVDTSTYCDYQLIFILHMHGLPLSSNRSLFIVIVSISLLSGLVVFYILFCILWPHIVRAWASLRWKINNIMASESYYTYATSTAGFSVHSHTVSEESLKAPSKAGSTEGIVEAEKAQEA